MKYLKKEEKKRGPVVIGLILVLLVAAAVIVFVLNQYNGRMHPAEDADSTAETMETAEAATEPVEVITEEPAIREYEVVELADGQIQTPYGILHYPESLADLLLVINTSQQPYTLEFYAVMEQKQELRLFDIALGEGSGGNMGTVMTSAGEVPLNVTIYTLDTNETWAENEITTAYAMQDAVNDLMEQLAPKTAQEEGEMPEISQQPVENGTVYNLEIETPYCTLYYPARWAGTVRYEVDDSWDVVYKVHFYSRISGLENQLLFSIYFGGDEGDQLGAVMSSEGIPVPVNLLLARLNMEGISEAEAELLYAMQEASNQLIERIPLLP